MTLDRFLRAFLGFGIAILIDVALARVVHDHLLANMPAPDADRLAHAVLVLALGAAVSGAACQLLAGHRSLAPYAVAAALLAGGMFWLKSFGVELQIFAVTIIFAGVSATLFAAEAADRMRRFL